MFTTEYALNQTFSLFDVGVMVKINMSFDFSFPKVSFTNLARNELIIARLLSWACGDNWSFIANAQSYTISHNILTYIGIKWSLIAKDIKS